MMMTFLYTHTHTHIECWPIKKQHMHKMDTVEMRMLRWMSGKSRKYKIKKTVISRAVSGSINMR